MSGTRERIGSRRGAPQDPATQANGVAHPVRRAPDEPAAIEPAAIEPSPPEPTPIEPSPPEPSPAEPTATQQAPTQRAATKRSTSGRAPAKRSPAKPSAAERSTATPSTGAPTPSPANGAAAAAPELQDPPSAPPPEAPEPTPAAAESLALSTAPAPEVAQATAAVPEALAPALPAEPGFIARARIRRRARYLRRLREVQLRDIGGFVLELHRFGQDRPDLLAAKVAWAAQTDAELRALERALGEEHAMGEIREAGIGGACENCGAVHGSQDRFCATCGEPLTDETGAPAT